MKVILFLVSFMGMIQGGMLSTQITPLDQSVETKNVKLLDQKILLFEKINGLKFSEISDLAYDSKKHRLYFVSDEGKLFTFEARFSEKIEHLKALTGVELVKKNGKRFKPWRRDSEGLAINNNAELFASFEGRAKIGKFDKNGNMVKEYYLPKKLTNQCFFLFEDIRFVEFA